MTLGAGQAMKYIEKERQAQMVTEDPNVNPALVPMVAIDAERYGDSLLDAAAVILTMAQYWRVIGPVIEDRRMSAKDRIAAATTPAEIEARRDRRLEHRTMSKTRDKGIIAYGTEEDRKKLAVLADTYGVSGSELIIKIVREKFEQLFGNSSI
ncbi:hypothetical protein GR210_18180 [Rhizobium leguminosarum]|uniref:hypothetical protein n=2 Tax=Rhizobium leguminosarum TaxID=384 RepID=UPI0013D98848|nr:hypothetical protein [Rhizobium leguminosarum]MBY5316740.1 hypothetical protein [Rhizobium leguminosarum]NEH50702.1 hypothetical protein [Rhizobium leguminosarum]